MFLAPSPLRRDLFQEFLRERFVYGCLRVFVYGIGWSFFLTYLFVLFFSGNRDPRFLLLDVLGLLYRFSGILLFKVFEIPGILVARFDPDHWLSQSARFTLRKHRPSILSVLFENLYGRYYRKSLLELGDEELDALLMKRLYRRYPWKTITTIFLPSLFSFSIFVVRFLFDG